MKYLQLGGALLTQAFANPLIDRGQTTKTTSQSGDSDESILSDSLLKDLRGHGIPVDYDAFMGEVSKLDQQIKMGIPVSSSKIRSIEALANRVIQQNDYLKEAEKLADKNEARGEIAVGNRGQLYTLDKNNKIKQISLSEYDIEKDGPAMTVNELIEHRKFNPTQQFDTTLTQVIGSNIGMQKINSYIQGIIQTMGEATDATEAYTDLASLIGKGYRKPTNEEFEAIKGLALEFNKLGPDAIFKIRQEKGDKNINAAFNYILRALPRDMQIQLKGRSVAEGYSLEEDNISDLVYSALLKSNKSTSKFEIDYQDNVNKRVNPAASSQKSFNQTTLEKWVDGDLNQGEFTFTDKNAKNKYGLKVKGTEMPQLTTDKNEKVSNLPLGEAINATIGAYLDKTKMYMGENKINEGMLNNIAYSSDKVGAVYMPVDAEGNIDWQGFHAFSEAQEYIKTNDIPREEWNKVHAEFGSYARFDSQGNQLQTDNTEKFAVTYGYTIDDYAEANGNTLYEEITGNEEDQASDLIKRIYGNKNLKKIGVKGIKGQWFFDDICKVPIFIKINQFANSDAYTYAGHGAYVPQRSLQQDMIQQQLNAPVPQEEKIAGSGDLLWN